MKIEFIASKNPNKQDVFEVNKDKGIEVSILDNNKSKLAHFYVGKNGPDLFSTYIRKEGSQQVVLTTGILKPVFEKELKYWRDKTIFKFSKNDIESYELKAKEGYKLTKNAKGEWILKDKESFVADKSKVDETLNTISSLRASDFAEGKLKEFGLLKPSCMVIVTLKDGSKKELLIGKQKNSFQYYVKRKDCPQVFVIEDYQLEKLKRPIKEFKKKEKQKKSATKH